MTEVSKQPKERQGVVTRSMAKKQASILDKSQEELKVEFPVQSKK
jgi:hypothetical protein